MTVYYLLYVFVVFLMIWAEKSSLVNTLTNTDLQLVKLLNIHSWLNNLSCVITRYKFAYLASSFFNTTTTYSGCRSWLVCFGKNNTIMISEQVDLYVSNDNKEKLCGLNAFDEIRSNTSKTILRRFPLIRYGWQAWTPVLGLTIDQSMAFLFLVSVVRPVFLHEMYKEEVIPLLLRIRVLSLKCYCQQLMFQ